ncbi:MAG: anti-sigma factor [Clostridia bacterium]
MNCGEVNEMMMRYFDGGINDIDCYYFKLHLKSCPVCSKQYAILSEAISYMELQPLLEPPEDFEKCVMNLVGRASAPKKNFLRIPMSIGYLLVSVLLLMLTTITILFMHSLPTIDLVRMIMNNGLSIEILNSILLTVEDCYRAVMILCNSAFDIYYILFKNYYDIVFSLAAIIVIGYSMRTKVVRHHQ